MLLLPPKRLKTSGAHLAPYDRERRDLVCYIAPAKAKRPVLKPPTFWRLPGHGKVRCKLTRPPAFSGMPQLWELLLAKTTILPASAKIRSGQVCASFSAPAQYIITLCLMSIYYEKSIGKTEKGEFSRVRETLSGDGQRAFPLFWLFNYLIQQPLKKAASRPGIARKATHANELPYPDADSLRQKQQIENRRHICGSFAARGREGPDLVGVAVFVRRVGS